MFGLALGVFQMFELVQIFENWAISPKIPHFQLLLKDLIDSLAPPHAHTHPAVVSLLCMATFPLCAPLTTPAWALRPFEIATINLQS